MARNYRPVNRYEPNRPATESPSKSIWNWLNLKSVLTLGAILSFTVGTLLYIEIKQQTCVFEYTNIPEQFKQKGFTEQFVVNTINKIQYQIINYDPPIRSTGATVDQKKTKDNTINQTLSSREMSSIENMNIQGIPLLSLIHITDRILKFLRVPVNENYASLEFTVIGDELHLAVLFKGIRKEYSTSCKGLSLKHAFYLLCYDASIFILEETKPITLADYYYDINRPEECISECLKVITSGKKNNEVISRAYTFWGLSLFQYTDNVGDKLKTAVQLDPDNHDARWLSLSLNDNASESYENSIRSLISKDSTVYAYWEQLLDLELRRGGTVDSVYLKLNQLNATMEKSLRGTPPPSRIYWDHGRAIMEWGGDNKKWYDTAIAKFQRAVECESHCVAPDLTKVSQYYNSIAFAYQTKAIINSGFDPDKCFNQTSSSTLPFFLEPSHAYAHQAVVADTLNPYAWSTLGEYYGLCYVVMKNPTYLERFAESLARACKYGFPMERFENTEPYCYIKRNHPKRYNKILRTEPYYQGPLAKLRQLRVL